MLLDSLKHLTINKSISWRVIQFELNESPLSNLTLKDLDVIQRMMPLINGLFDFLKLVEKEHPVLKGMSDFKLFDEVYGNTEVLETVTPLLGTDHPESSKIIGWENKYSSSIIIYLQPGHGKETYQDSNYRLLLEQAIHYLDKTN